MIKWSEEKTFGDKEVYARTFNSFYSVYCCQGLKELYIVIVIFKYYNFYNVWYFKYVNNFN